MPWKPLGISGVTEAIHSGVGGAHTTLQHHSFIAHHAPMVDSTEVASGWPLPLPTVEILTEFERAVLIPLTAVMSAASLVGGTLLIVFCARALRNSPAAASQSAKAARMVQFVLLMQGIADVSDVTGFEHALCVHSCQRPHCGLEFAQMRILCDSLRRSSPRGRSSSARSWRRREI